MMDDQQKFLFSFLKLIAVFSSVEKSLF